MDGEAVSPDVDDCLDDCVNEMSMTYKSDL
jgi:hypothetical protein